VAERAEPGAVARPPVRDAATGGQLRRGHHGAMAWQDVPAFLAEIDTRRGRAPLALRFTILTAARSGEVRHMTWGEVQGDVWRVPASRMKGGREHRVPLSDAARALLDGLPGGEADALVFEGARPGRPLSDMTLAAVLKRSGRDGITVHGFRSSFSTWCAETTDTPLEVREAALAHASGDKVAAAYQRGDMFARRRELMDRWAAFCGGL